MVTVDKEKGFDVKSGWVGILVNGEYREFPTEEEYDECFEDE